MRFRTYTIALAAATFPVLIFVAALLMRVADDERHALETSARIQVERLGRNLDREIYGQIKAVEVLAGSDALRHDDFAGFYEDAARFDRADPLWHCVTLADASTKRTLFTTQSPFGTELQVPERLDGFEEAVQSRAPVVAGLSGGDPLTGKPLIAIRVPILRGGGTRYVLSAYVNPDWIADVLRESGLPPNWRGAIIDRDGRFIARSGDAAPRAGARAGPHLRNAIKTMVGGLRSPDNASDYSAYYTSALTGWSVNLELPESALEAPIQRSFWAMIALGIAALAVSGFVIFLFFRMSAQQRLAEARAQESMRLQALGRLTGGVAHDFNNLLAVIIGNAEIARANVDGAIARRLDAVLRAAARAENLTRQLLTFSRRQPVKPVVLDLRKRLPKLLEMLRPSLPADIVVGLDVDPALWPVEIDPGELEIALINIAANARDAMPRGGRLDITARNVTCNERSGPGTLVGDFVLISIADSGHGMPREVIERAFEPFFTTKEVGRGTGLGLSQVYGFAQQGGGTAVLNSALGSGTAVLVYLRRSTKTPAEADAAANIGTRAARQRRLLLVEDDADVAETTVAMLTELGFAVQRADRAQRALDLIGSGEATPELVLTDIVMPDGMSGVELARRIRAARPGLPILLMTAHDSGIAASGDEFPILRKPFKRAELAAMLEGALVAASRPNLKIVEGNAG